MKRVVLMDRQNILYDCDLAFHGINNDLMKFISIIKSGIVSKEQALKEGIRMDVNYCGHNGNDYISLSESPSMHNTFNFGSFHSYAKKGMSFIVDVHEYCIYPDLGLRESHNGFKQYDSIERHSGNLGEIYIRNRVDVKDIVGIMLPSTIYDSEISKVSIGLDVIGKDYVDITALNFIKKIAEEFGYVADISQLENMILKKSKKEYLNPHEYLKNHFEYLGKENGIICEMERFLTNYLSQAIKQKFGVDNPTVGFLIQLYNKNNLPIYSNDGYIIGERNTKK
jgi:hypothetical protein